MISIGGTVGGNPMPSRGTARAKQWGWEGPDVTESLGNEGSNGCGPVEGRRR